MTKPEAIAGTAGIYSVDQIPMSAYLADPCLLPSLSSGTAHRLLTKTPQHAHWSHPRLGGHPGEPSNASDIGSVAHDLLLGEGDTIVIVDAPDWRTKAAQTERDEARAAGRNPILRHAYEEALEMSGAAANFLDDSEIAGVMENGEAENTVIAHIGETWIRTRPDWMNRERRILMHYKTTKASANPDAFIRGILPNMGYDIAMSLYRTALEDVIDDADKYTHVMLVQEQAAPFACSLITLDPAMWAIADGKVSSAMSIWARCMRDNRWPGYGGMIHYASPTPWALAQAEEQALGNE